MSKSILPRGYVRKGLSVDPDLHHKMKVQAIINNKNDYEVYDEAIKLYLKSKGVKLKNDVI